MADFLWDEVIDALVRHRNVVPVIGEELLVIETASGPVPFSRLLGQRLAKRQGLPSAAEPPSISDVVVALRNNRVPIIRVTSSLMAAFKELLDELGDRAIPESVRLLRRMMAAFAADNPPPRESG